MKLIGLMLARNEDWVIGASLRAALGWCDEVVLVMDRCTDRTMDIACEVAKESGDRLLMGRFDDKGDHWDEMGFRQWTLDAGRAAGGTHFAIIDADEILTQNMVKAARTQIEALRPAQLLDVPMIPVCRGLDYFWDSPVWHHNHLTLAFADAPHLTWKPRADGYQHHHRPPHGATDDVWRPFDLGHGGVMHLQFTNQRRLVAKHVLYRMVDFLRWPKRRTKAQLNRIYDEALAKPEPVGSIDRGLWGTWRRDLIDLYGVPWQEEEIRKLLKEHGVAAFEGLDLKGFA